MLGALLALLLPPATRGGRGDATSTNVRWRYHRGIPQLPSPLVYGGVYWMLADSGGLLTELDPATGELLGKRRLTRGRTRTTPRPWRATARSTS